MSKEAIATSLRTRIEDATQKLAAMRKTVGLMERGILDIDASLEKDKKELAALESVPTGGQR